LGKFWIKCPICGERFESYSEFWEHVVSSHPNSLKMRFKAEIIRVED